MATSATKEKALLTARIFQTPRDKVSNPVLGPVATAHHSNDNRKAI
jgi:hypothetical protein